MLAMLYGDLNEKKIKKRGDICNHLVDSLCCTAETNITLVTPRKINSNKKRRKHLP